MPEPRESYRVRPHEWVLTGFFIYIAAIAQLRPLQPGRGLKVLFVAAAALALLMFASALHRKFDSIPSSIFRDLVALALVLTAYRAMDLFSPAQHSYTFEPSWVAWDRILFYDWGLKPAIESAGFAFPVLLELSYLLVYAIGPFGLAVLYAHGHFRRSGWVLLSYVLGTLLAYSMFPYFPSEPPRTVFPGADLPLVPDWLRRLNLRIVGNYGIHVSVMPSAHVSSAIAGAYALTRALPENLWYGRGLLIYALVVSLATLYGRYHYAIDALAGGAVGLLTVAILRRWQLPSKATAPRSSEPRPADVE